MHCTPGRTFATMPLLTLHVLAMLVLVAIISASGASAMVVSDVTIDDTLDQGAVRETITVSFDNNTLPSVRFSLPEGARDVVLNGKRVDTVNGSVDIPLPCVHCEFSLVYVLPDVVATEGEGLRSFSRTLSLPESPERMTYLLRLPKGGTISSSDIEPAIVPAPAELRTDGQRIIVRWSESRPKLPERYFVRYADTGPAHDENSFFSEFMEWPVWVLIGVALAIGIAAGMGAQRHLHERFKEDESLPFVPYKLLSPDERVIVTLLQSRGVLGQKEIGKELSWSKSKVSAIMTGLEHKEIVSREKVGRNYQVTLEKAIRE